MRLFFSCEWFCQNNVNSIIIVSLLLNNRVKTEPLRCVPELALEVWVDSCLLVVTGARGACSEGLPLRVKELIAHLHGIGKYWTQGRKIRRMNLHFSITCRTDSVQGCKTPKSDKTTIEAINSY